MKLSHLTPLACLVLLLNATSAHTHGPSHLRAVNATAKSRDPGLEGFKPKKGHFLIRPNRSKTQVQSADWSRDTELAPSLPPQHWPLKLPFSAWVPSWDKIENKIEGWIWVSARPAELDLAGCSFFCNLAQFLTRFLLFIFSPSSTFSWQQKKINNYAQNKVLEHTGEASVKPASAKTPPPTSQDDDMEDVSDQEPSYVESLLEQEKEKLLALKLQRLRQKEAELMVQIKGDEGAPLEEQAPGPRTRTRVRPGKARPTEDAAANPDSSFAAEIILPSTTITGVLPMSLLSNNFLTPTAGVDQVVPSLLMSVFSTSSSPAWPSSTILLLATESALASKSLLASNPSASNLYPSNSATRSIEWWGAYFALVATLFVL
ncbi:uncharacterized protein VTP21DRAFT_5231 [Calcarisporiella thermophila]|uniref:uncharacterized protein n=1 Tax=Calcarisporiella thermophila TaxID=911321 RepID=UPI003744ADCC